MSGLSGFFPENGRDDLLIELKKMDSYEPRLGSKKLIGTMMSRPLPISVKAFMMFIDRNLNDTLAFKQSNKVADHVIKALHEISGGGEGGIITYGGSESNLTALFIARELGYQEVIVPTSAHSSIRKAAKVVGLNIVEINLDDDYRLSLNDLDDVMKGRDEALIVATAGTTDAGRVDNVKAIYKEHPDALVYVDAAYGGFIIPFLRELGYNIPEADFRVPNVLMMGIDGHKMGLSPIPSGALLFKDSHLAKYITFDAPYLLGGKQTTLLWTRTAGSAYAMWASINYLGKKGFKEITGKCMNNALYFYKSLINAGFNALRPELPIVCFKHSLINTDKLISELRRKGWVLYKCPSFNGAKVTFMPHVDKEIIDELLDDLSQII